MRGWWLAAVVVAACDGPGAMEDDPTALACVAVAGWIAANEPAIIREAEGSGSATTVRMTGCSALTRDGEGTVTAEADLVDTFPAEDIVTGWVEITCKVSGYDQGWVVDSCAITDSRAV